MDAIIKIKVDMSKIDLFIHGTTVGINTIVQEKGSKVGLISTDGFTDVLEMGRGNKKELYNYMEKKPKPLVPRYLRMPVRERLTHTGEVLERIDEEEVKNIINKFKSCGVEAIAICLLHAHVNPENEMRLGEIILNEWPDVTLALSHQVAKEIREYERTSTTVINAYIEKAVVHYLYGLEKNLKEAKFVGQLLVLGSSGILGIEAIKERSIHTLASGPIGGAAGAAHLAELCGIKDIVTMDVGGTSFDVSVIKDGFNIEKHQTEIMGYPVLMAGMDIRPIGAGGGSIARVDAAGLLTVGPESAGANPGPMAYRMGGNEPTVTDAALVNGLIDPDYFFGGEIRLDMELAEKGIIDIARRLGLSLNEAAYGILTVARNSMTTATMEILIGQGFDPRDFALISYGGAGGIFAASLAEDMSISHIIIPTSPGVFSARGILTMNLVHTFSNAYGRALAELNVKDLDNIFRGIEKNAQEILKTEGMFQEDIEFSRSLDICFEGQRYYIETSIPPKRRMSDLEMIDIIEHSFEHLYEKRYGHLINAPLRTINARLKATGRIKEIPVPEIDQGKDIPKTVFKKSRRIFLEGDFFESRVYERSGLLCGNMIHGPAVIEEPFHTTVVMPNQTLRVDQWGNLIIQTGEE
jgi:N-methylhydantoinase A